MRSWILVLAAACGDSAMPGGIDAPSPAIDADISQCGAVGRACGSGCPSPLECVNDACVPRRGDCGGFAGAECSDTSLACTYPSGSSAGICMQEDEKECVCAISPDALGDCAPPGSS